MAIEWVIQTIAGGAAVVFSAQVTISESAGFECSNTGLSVIAKLEQLNSFASTDSQIELVIGQTKIELDPVFMLETKPQFWAGTVVNPQVALTSLDASEKIRISVPGRTVELDINTKKSKDFVSEYVNRMGKK